MTEIARGLRNVVLTETRMSKIDGQAGKLTIAGFPLEEIAPVATHEEMVFLLWYDRLPTRTELEEFRSSFIQHRTLSDTTLRVLQTAAERGVPVMDALRMGTDTLSLFDPEPENLSREANLRRAVRIVAPLPTIVATYWRFSQGKKPVEADPSLLQAANFLYMLEGRQPDPAAVRALETYLNTVIDHGMNNSTFTARVIASTRSDMISAVVGAIGSLKGPLHGGAPGPAADMVFEIIENAKRSGKSVAEEARIWVNAKLAARERIMGFGHRVYKVRDPRADVLGGEAERLFQKTGQLEFYANARTVEDVILSALAEYKPNNPIKTNVEFYTALVLYGIGLSTSVFSPVFAISRASGWIAHIMEQYDEDELIRPDAYYKGVFDRKWVPLEDRS